MEAATCLGLALAPDTEVSDNQLNKILLGSNRNLSLLETQVKVVFV